MELTALYLRSRRVALLFTMMFKFGLFCSVSSEVCLSSPCQNNGTCVHTVGGYLCVCASGPLLYEGPNCERLYDPCHHASCPDCHGTPGTRHHACVCPAGFGGPDCTHDLDECQSHPCTGVKGHCVDEAGGFSCHCASGWAGEDCRTRVRDCSDEPCLHNATCEWARGGYECHCARGFSGQHCEDDVDECLSGPCQNGAVCLDGAGFYLCYCVPGFQGNHCEIDIDECASLPCHNNATCVNGKDRYACECLVGFTGVNCEVDIDECDASPCQNGATCHNHVGLHTCQCLPGYEGVHCELDVDECESAPCQHGARCLDRVDGFECDCSGSGFVGLVCETHILECLSNPCQHGATCRDGVNQYSCLCWPGFEGEHCEVDVDECESGPCENGGECFQRSEADLYGLLPELDWDFSFENATGHLCRCTAGFTGLNCSLEVNECDSSPCVNGGTCQDLVNAFHCTCPSGFTGLVCEINIDDCESHPCQNGGQCQDGVNAYTCLCPAPAPDQLPWGGAECHVALTACVRDPCENGATCVPHLHGDQHHLTCLCPAGFCGARCQTPTTFSVLPGSFVQVEVPQANRTRRQTGAPDLVVRVRFRTTLPDGILFYRGTGEHFFSLELVAGQLHSRAESGRFRLAVRLKGDFSDGLWHEASVGVDDRLVLMSDNNSRVEDGGHNQLLSFLPLGLEKLYLAGVPGGLLNRTTTRTGFTGCFQDLLVDFHPVVPEDLHPQMEVQAGCEKSEWCQPDPCSERGRCVDLWSGFRCDCWRPFHGHDCSEEHTSWTFSHERNRSFATFPVLRRHGGGVGVSFWLRSRRADGLILQLQRRDRAYFTVFLRNGSIHVAVRSSVRAASDIITHGEKVFVSIKKQQSLIFYNQERLVFDGRDGAAFEVEAGDVAYLGGLPDGEDALAWGGHFKGCLQDVRLDDTQLFMYSGRISQKPPHPSYLPRNTSNLLEQCVSDQACRLQPCGNGGECQRLWNDFVCSCPLNFSGKTCERRVWCGSDPCQPGTRCVELPDGYECLANATFEGDVLKFSARGSLTVPVRSVSLELRTRDANATLLRASSGAEFFCVGLLRSSLVLTFRSGRGPEVQTFTSPVPVSDGDWHGVRLYLSDSGNSSRWFLTVDGQAAGYSLAWAGTVDYFNSSTVWLAENYTGCLGEVRVGGIYLPLSGSLMEVAPQASQFTRVGETAKPQLGCSGPPVCHPPPCQNNGTCRDLFHLLRCQCGPGWTGDRCQRNVDECQRQPCVHGRCRDLPGDYECQCPPGYGGKRCQLEVDECQEHGCEGGGSCVPGAGTYTCLCPPGRSGPLCQWRFPPQECDVDLQCENKGVCTDGPDGPNCVCKPGFTGDRCEVDVDECASSPCLNGGTCVNRRNRFTCECVSGFSGDVCQDAGALRPETLRWLMVAVPLVCVAALLGSLALVCALLAAQRKRRSEGTYSPSRQEVAGARLEMGRVLKVPPEERLI